MSASATSPLILARSKKESSLDKLIDPLRGNKAKKKYMCVYCHMSKKFKVRNGMIGLKNG
jgi:hypothetical protein